MRKLLLSTNNEGKAREFEEIFRGLPLEVVTPSSLGLTLEVEENGATFAENAALKARAYHEATGLLAVADDSGLEVDALGGEPGVYSARWRGLPDGPTKNALVLKLLEGLPPEKRGCRYVCEVAIVDEEGRLHRCRAIFRGVIAESPRGEGGFGFDPIFLVPGRNLTMAELTMAEKNRLSHRGRAGRCARRLLAKLTAGEQEDPPTA